MIKLPILIVCVCSLILEAAQEGYLCKSELYTSYAGSGSKTLKLYNYDSDGQKYQLRLFAGEDTLSAASTKILYSYNPNKNITTEATITGTDTVSKIRYSYNNQNLLSSMQRYNSEDSLLFKDSLFYSSMGKKIQTVRFKASGDTISYNQCYYENDNLYIDSSFQYDSDNLLFSPQMIRVLEYADNGAVARVREWSLIGARFSVSRTTTLEYIDGKIADSVTWVGDQATKSDSVSFSYDDNGNCIRKSFFEFTPTAELMATIDFRWYYTGTQIVSTYLPVYHDKLHIMVIENNIIVHGIGHNIDRFSYSIADISGKKIILNRIHNNETLTIQTPSLAPGRYFLLIRSAQGVYVSPFVR